MAIGSTSWISRGLILSQKEICSDVLNKPKHGKLFRKFREELMIVSINYDGKIDKNYTSDHIVGVKTEGEKTSNDGSNNLSISKEELMGSVKKKLLNIPPLQEFVEVFEEKKIINGITNTLEV